ncbi:hypothetical protein PG995_012940 [Apiospora arundinis]
MVAKESNGTTAVRLVGGAAGLVLVVVGTTAVGSGGSAVARLRGTTTNVLGGGALGPSIVVVAIVARLALAALLALESKSLFLGEVMIGAGTGSMSISAGKQVAAGSGEGKNGLTGLLAAPAPSKGLAGLATVEASAKGLTFAGATLN